jgi:MbtH protein
VKEKSGSDRHVVVLNDEEQYSIWPEDRPLPTGWRSSGIAGTREECLSEIARVWVDMRPKSLRDAISDDRKRER